MSLGIVNSTQCAATPLRDHVARFWKYLETETVRIVLDLKRTVGTDAPDGPVVYWDGSTFSDDVAKALVAERAAAAEMHAAITEYLALADSASKMTPLNMLAVRKSRARLRSAAAAHAA